MNTLSLLRRLQAATLQAGGPFIGMGDNVSRQWGRIRKHAGTVDVTIHDPRRTFVTRLLRCGVRVDTVKRLAGHSSLTTTLKYYARVNDSDLHDAIKLLSTANAG